MKIYLDTSALVKIYVEETGSFLVRRTVGQANLVATSAMAYVEARAAFVRRRHEGGLSFRQYRYVIRHLDDDWSRYLVVGVTDTIIRDAARLAEKRYLRTYDAVHLASAVAIHDQTSEPLVFVSWDHHLGRAAGQEGFEILRP